MADKITTLQLKADPDTKIYPNVKDENIPDTIARQSDLDEAKAGIATNKAGIATNKAGIATNKADINTNKADINTNKADIAINKGSISRLRDDLSNKVTTKDVEADSGTIASLHATDFELGSKSDGSPLIHNDSNDLVQIDNVENIKFGNSSIRFDTLGEGDGIRLSTTQSSLALTKSAVLENTGGEIGITEDQGPYLSDRDNHSVYLPHLTSNETFALRRDIRHLYQHIINIVFDNGMINFLLFTNDSEPYTFTTFVQYHVGITFPVIGYYDDIGNTNEYLTISSIYCYSDNINTNITLTYFGSNQFNDITEIDESTGAKLSDSVRQII